MGRSIRSLLLCFSLLTAVMNPVNVLAEEAPAEDTIEEVSEEGESAGITETETEGEDSGANLSEPSEGEELPEETVAPSEDPETVISETEEPVQPDEEPEPQETEVTEVSEESPDEEISEEETEEAVLFEVPEGFPVNSSDIEVKKELNERLILSDFDKLEEGKDYIGDELVFLTDDIEYAKEVADIYHARLKSFGYGVAVIAIEDDDISVRDAFEASIDLDGNLPFVEPNYIRTLEPIPVVEEEDANVLFADTDKAQTWKEWVNSVFEYPDPAIKEPSSDTYQWQHDVLNTYSGWNAAMGDGVTVAVLDQGVNPDHEDFKDDQGISRVTKHELSEEIDGEPVFHGYSYGTGHGTHVAGIIGSTVNNNLGGAGVAPDVSILAVDVFGTDKEKGSSEWVSRGINYAVSQNVDVINMSLGSYGYSQNEQTAITAAVNKGIIVCVSAGNDGSNIKCYPAACKDVICVASSNRNNGRASYSNYGSWITLAAPGSDIYSTYSTEADKGSYYELMSGTSMACPVVTGAIALYMSKFGRKDTRAEYNDILKLLKSSCVKSSSSGMGYGVISVEKMFNRKEIAPKINVLNEDGTPANIKNALNPGSSIEISVPHPVDESTPEYVTNDVIIYTTNGKNPSVKNGQIVSGEIYKEKINVDDFIIGTTVTIKAATVNDFGVMGAVKTLKIKTPKIIPASVKVKTLSFDTKVHKSDYSSVSPMETFKITPKLIDTTGGEPHIDDVPHAWTTSNAKVAIVEEGNVTIVGPGTAKINLKLLDGSGKSAACTVTATQVSEQVTIKGQDYMAPGTSATFTAAVSPAATKNKKVVWSLGDGTPAGIKLKGAKITVSKDVPENTTFTLKAAPADGHAESAELTITVLPKVKEVKLDTDYERAVYEGDKLISVNLFTYDLRISDEDEINKTAFQLSSSVTRDDLSGSVPPVYVPGSVIYSSSNKKVVTVSEDGTVQAVGKGTAKITATANDGSKKKTTVTVKVDVPVSNLSIDLGGFSTVTAGKSLPLDDKVMYGSQYGAPTTKKVEWSITGVEYKSKLEPVNDTENYPFTDMTEAVLGTDFLSFNKGKLVVGKHIPFVFDEKREQQITLEDYEVRARLHAKSLDGTDYTAETWITIAPELIDPFTYVYGWRYSLRYGYEEGYFTTKTFGTLSYSKGSAPTILLFSSSPIQYEVKSSNPNVAGAIFINGYYTENPEDHNYYYRSIEDPVYIVDRRRDYYGYTSGIQCISTGKKGTATITVKALDGSGKTIKFKIKFK